MKNIHGIVLLAVLILLQILAILSLSVMHMAWLETIQSRNSVHKYIIQENANVALNQIETNLNQILSMCTINGITTQELLSHSLDWWKKTCAGNFQTFQYYYVVENLGIDSCTLIESSPNKKAHYYRITLLGLKQNAKIMLQNTIVLPDDDLFHCEGQLHRVTKGRQMQREL